MSLRRVARPGVVLSLSLAAMVAASIENAYAQENGQAKKEERKPGWSNTTDLSLVVTGGNSESTTWAFTDQLRYVWPKARFEFGVDVLRSNKSDDHFFLVEPGLEFPVGGAPSNP